MFPKHILRLLMRFLTLFFCFSFLNLQAQEDFLPTQNIADCIGAVELQNQGEFKTAFTGKAGNVDDFFFYKHLTSFQETNSLYFKFSAPFNGKLDIEAAISKGKFQLIIFKNVSDNIAEDVFDGKATVLKSFTKGVSTLKITADSSNAQDLNSLEVKTNDVLIFVFNTAKNVTEHLEFVLNFEKTTDIENSDKRKKLIDERKNADLATMEIQVRDAETGLPIISEVNIKDKKKSTLYVGSDFIFSTEKSQQITIKCNATGYFFAEEQFKVHLDSSKRIILKLHPISKGKNMKIDKLQFMKGTDQIYLGTEFILIRLKDFLLLNADIKVEIQGHVNNEGENDFSSKKLSRQRAKRIRDFFIASGISRNRLSTKACSNKIPIYPNPKNDIESQANRRVEIKIK